MFVGIIKVLIL